MPAWRPSINNQLTARTQRTQSKKLFLLLKIIAIFAFLR